MKIIIFAIIIATAACNSQSKPEHLQPKQDNQKKKNNIEIDVTSKQLNTITIGDEITFNYKVTKANDPDSTHILIAGTLYKTYAKNEVLIWNSANTLPGKQQVSFQFFWGDSITVSKTMNYTLLSDIKPKKYTYKVLNKWPHNVKSYTQGLEFSDGFLYEGTGNYGASMLCKMDLDKNEVIQSLNLSDDVFGEGITILNNKIYQLTWRSNIGYVYNKETLTKLYDFNYPTEGWGLTNNGTELIMSDGSENIYFLDTEFIQQTNKLQVYDHSGAVKKINELEYYKGIIYANIYGSDAIVAIDAKTGKVLKNINLSGILDKSNVKTPVDVLNGIAIDHTNNRMIVTGKWWPYFYEIELIETK